MSVACTVCWRYTSMSLYSPHRILLLRVRKKHCFKQQKWASLSLSQRDRHSRCYARSVRVSLSPHRKSSKMEPSSLISSMEPCFMNNSYHPNISYPRLTPCVLSVYIEYIIPSSVSMSTTTHRVPATGIVHRFHHRWRSQMLQVSTPSPVSKS